MKEATKKKKSIVPSEEVSAFLKKGWIIVQTIGDKYEIRAPEKWEKFEFDTREFLKKTGFEDAQGGAGYKLGGFQIDACGGCDGTYLVIECKSKEEPELKSIHDYIVEFLGKKKDIETDVLVKYAGKYKRIAPILCLEDIDVSSTDRQFAEKQNIAIWDREYLNFYLGVDEFLGSSAKYHILADLGFSPTEVGKFEVPVMKITFRGLTMYNFLIEPENLLRIAYVFRRGLAGSMAYQRALSPSRIGRITTFIEEKGGFFVNNLILNFKEPLTFKNFEEILGTGIPKPDWMEMGLLSIPKKYCSAQVIDGQHRLYGFTTAEKAKKELRLMVTAFEKLDEEEQAKIFVDINREQKPVPPNLLWDLLGQIREKSADGVISILVKKLEEESKSPFANKIYVPAKHGVTKKGKPVLLANFCNGIKSLHLISEDEKHMKDEHNIWKGSSDLCLKTAYNIFFTYFTAASKKFDFDWKKEKKGFFLTNNGVNILLRLLREALIFNDRKPLSKSQCEGMFDCLIPWLKKKTDKDLAELRRVTSNEAGRATVALELIRLIHKKYDPKFGAVILAKAAKK